MTVTGRYGKAGKRVVFSDAQLALLKKDIKDALPKAVDEVRDRVQAALLDGADEYIRSKRVIGALPKAEEQIKELRRAKKEAGELAMALATTSDPARALLEFTSGMELEEIESKLRSFSEACDESISSLSRRGGRSEDLSIRLLVIRVRTAMTDNGFKPGKTRSGPFGKLLESTFALCELSANVDYWVAKMPTLK